LYYDANITLKILVKIIHTVVRNFDGGRGNDNQASAFDYLMQHLIPIVFKVSFIKGVFFWHFFLNNTKFILLN